MPYGYEPRIRPQLLVDAPTKEACQQAGCTAEIRRLGSHLTATEGALQMTSGSLVSGVDFVSVPTQDHALNICHATSASLRSATTLRDAAARMVEASAGNLASMVRNSRRAATMRSTSDAATTVAVR